MELTGENFIGYTASKAGNKSFRTFNPILDTYNLTVHYNATNKEINDAAEKARAAFPIYARTSYKERAAFLLKIAELLHKNRQDLLAVYHKESGLPLQRGESELNRTIHQLELFAKVITARHFGEMAQESADRSRKPAAKPSFHKILLPLGPVVVFGASNFPFAYSTIGGDAASALAAGCPVIIKSHPMHAGTSEAVTRIVLQAARNSHMPDGIFSNLNAATNTIGEQLVKHPYIKAVGFTGSIAGGTALLKYGQDRPEPIPVFCEMGSLNPVFIFPGSSKKRKEIASRLAVSITNDSGQFCTKPGLIFIENNENGKFFIQELKEAFLQQGSQPMLQPSICNNYHTLINAIDQLPRVKILRIPPLQKNFGTPQLSFADFRSFQKHLLLQQEVFGPHSVIISCTKEEFEQAPLLLSGNLTASVWMDRKELKSAADFMFLLQQKAGRIIFNGVPTGVEVTHGMHHGGPFPSTSDSRFTAVGNDAIYRFLRPVSLQNF